MPAGNWPAGTIPAGFDIGESGFGPVLPTGSEKYDPRLRIVVVDGDGNIENVHFIDQEVAFALGIPLGSIPSSPDIGLDWNAIKRASEAAARQTIQDSVASAVARLLRIHAITLGTIEYKGVAAAGRRSFRVPYRNLLAPAPQTRIAKVG